GKLEIDAAEIRKLLGGEREALDEQRDPGRTGGCGVPRGFQGAEMHLPLHRQNRNPRRERQQVRDQPPRQRKRNPPSAHAGYRNYKYRRCLDDRRLSAVPFVSSSMQGGCKRRSAAVGEHGEDRSLPKRPAVQGDMEHRPKVREIPRLRARKPVAIIGLRTRTKTGPRCSTGSRV